MYSDLPPSKPVSMKPARRPLSPTSQATSKATPTKTGMVTAILGIQKRLVLSAMMPQTKAATMLMAVVIVGSVLIWTMEYMLSFALRYRENG